MIIATSLATYLDETHEWIKALNLAKEDGFKGIGIMIQESLNYYMENLSILKQSGLKFCVHANLIDTNIASLNEGIRKESVNQVKEAIILAKALSAEIVTFHPGKYRNYLLEKDAYEKLFISLEELLPFAKERTIKLALENMEPRGNNLCVKINQIDKVINRYPELGLCLDVAHAGMVTENFIEYLDVFRDKIIHFHISGVNYLNSHVEVSLKESRINFSLIINEISGFECMLRIENRTREKTLESLEFINNIIKR